MKKLFFFFSLFSACFLFLIFVDFVFAQSPADEARPLEITYPKIEGIEAGEIPATVKTPAPIYIKYIYYFIVGIGGLLALGVLFYGGFRYLTSAGSPEVLKDAKDQIFAALFGLVILLSSWLILYNINPQLVTFTLKPLGPTVPPQFSGILLCKEAVPIENYYYQRERAEQISKQLEKVEDEATRRKMIDELKKITKYLNAVYAILNEKCYFVGSKGNLPKEWDNKIKRGTGKVYIIPTKYLVKEGNKIKEKIKSYGVIIFEDKDYKDDMQWYTSGDPNKSPRPVFHEVKIKDISSVIPHTIISERKGADENWQVILYEEVNYNKEVPEKWRKTFLCPVGSYQCGFKLDKSPRSLEIKAQDRTIVILTTGEIGGGYYKMGHVFVMGDPNLLKYDRISCPSIKQPACICPLPEVLRGGCPTATYLGILYGEIY